MMSKRPGTEKETSCKCTLMNRLDPTRIIVVIWVNLFKSERTIEIQLVRLTEVCGKVPSEKNAYKSVKTALLLSKMLLMRTTETAVCLQTKAIFHHIYGFLLVSLLNFMSNTLPIALTRLLECISTISSVRKKRPM